MEGVVTCLGFLVVAALLVPFAFAFAHARKIKALEISIQKLTSRTVQLEAQLGGRAPAPETSTPFRSSVPASAPPPIPGMPASSSIPPAVSPAPAPILTTPVSAVPPPPAPSPKAAPRAARPPRAAIDWESFLGVKLFAWIGGFVLFLGVVFLVKYSFENNLITPLMRVVIGAVIGCILVAAGWFTARRNYRVPGQSLCATGVLVLYADVFGAHAFYALISLTTAFSLMSVITVAAFALAVRLDAQVVVVLGLVGGFLTPPLLTAVPENPLRLFGYVALLNAGIAAVALRKRWNYLLLLGAIGTALTEIAWLDHFHSSRATAGFLIFLGFEAQFLLFAYLIHKRQPAEKWSTISAALMGVVALGFASFILIAGDLASRPGYFFGLVFLVDLGLLTLATWRPNPAQVAAPTGAIVFAILATWTGWYLEDQLLWWALGAYSLFALIHAGFSVWPSSSAVESKRSSRAWMGLIPLLALGLLFICVWHGETSFAVWTCVLLIDLVAVAIAWLSLSLLALFVALVLTLLTAGLWILTAPPITDSVAGILVVVAGFGVFFSTASTFLANKLGIGAGKARRHLPALSAAMPFVLLLMLIAKLPIGAPTAVFAVALLLAIVLLGFGIVSRTSWIAAVALAFTWAVELEWHSLHFTNSHALLVLGWYVAFLLVFTAYPFFVAEEQTQLPWAIGAMSGFLHYWLIGAVIESAYPNLRNGLLPALFILPYAFGVFHLIKRHGVLPASGDARLAWQGGTALFFLSLIFPIQFDREWLTLGWSLEGFALLVLFRSVPNEGLRRVGAGLLSLAFVRLALNPAVLEYHRRSPIRIWNWYLYVYGLTSLCLFGGARLVQQYRDPLLARIIPRLLYTLGVALTFLLLNIEIADYYSVGPTLTFSFSGNFARDMTYSIAWALFAFALLLIGMKKELRYVRYAGLALLLVTLVKLFLHDLGNLSQLYRIGAFMGVALILIVASFVYQRFLSPPSTKSTP